MHTIEAIELVPGGFVVSRKRTKRALTEPHENIELGRRLHTLRKQKGLSQTELAERLKITQRAVSYYEKGTVRVPAPMLLRLAEVLDLTIPELLGKKQVANTSEDRKIIKLIRNVETLPPKKQRRIVEYIELISKG